MATFACGRVFTHFHAEFKHRFVNWTLGRNQFVQRGNTPLVAQLLQVTDGCLTLFTHTHTYKHTYTLPYTAQPITTMMLASEPAKGSNSPSVRSPMVYEDRQGDTRPRLGSVLCVPFSVLTQMAG